MRFRSLIKKPSGRFVTPLPTITRKTTMQAATTAHAIWLNRAQVSGCAGSRHPGHFQLTKIITNNAALANIFFILSEVLVHASGGLPNLEAETDGAQYFLPWSSQIPLRFGI